MQVSASVLDLVCKRIKFCFLNLGFHSLVVGRQWRERETEVRELERNEGDGRVCVNTTQSATKVRSPPMSLHHL